jgi:hypothetical protein
LQVGDARLNMHLSQSPCFPKVRITT